MKLGPLLALLACLAVHGCHGASKPDIEVTPYACGRTKACLQPAGCKDSRCPYFASWRKVFVNGREYMEFELEGDVISKEGYIAITMSPDTKEVRILTSNLLHVDGNEFVGGFSCSVIDLLLLPLMHFQECY